MPSREDLETYVGWKKMTPTSRKVASELSQFRLDSPESIAAHKKNEELTLKNIDNRKAEAELKRAAIPRPGPVRSYYPK